MSPKRRRKRIANLVTVKEVHAKLSVLFPDAHQLHIISAHPDWRACKTFMKEMNRIGRATAWKDGRYLMGAYTNHELLTDISELILRPKAVSGLELNLDLGTKLLSDYLTELRNASVSIDIYPDVKL